MKGKIKNAKILSVLLLFVIVLTTVFATVAVQAGAENASEGMAFKSTNMYQTSKSIGEHTSFTFETEIHLSPNFGDKKRAFNIIGNWSTNTDDRDKQEWGIELHNYGVVRLFHVSGKSIFFHGGDNTSDIAGSTNATYLSDLKNDYYSKGLKPAFDVRGYMGTDENPEYAKITITADTVTGDAHLYINGNLVQSVLGSAAVKGRTYKAGTKHPYHIIGGDYRDNNSGAFQGKIKNIALYAYVRTAEEVAADAAGAFSVDVKDEKLLLAYDLTKARDGFIEDLSTNKNNANDLNWTTTEGRAFTAEDELFVNGVFTKMPRTYEAWIYPTAGTSRSGVILGNYGSGSAVLLNFEIHSSGKPSIYIKDDKGNLMDEKFNYDIRRSTWAHLVITHETLESGGARFTCYVDGVKVDSFDTDLSYEFDPSNLSLLSLGGDSRSGNSQYFKGRIKDVAWYSEVLTEAEIKDSYKNGVNESEDSLILHYELDGKDGATYIPDSADGGFDLHAIYHENMSPATDYAYSFAIVGDTQKLVYNDAYKGTDYTSYIYDWIVQNAASKKIAFVMGMGDITDKNGKDQTPDDAIDQTDIEWDIAKAQHKKLTDAGIPYGIIMGNHENVASLDTHFMGNENYQKFTGDDIGYYSGTSLGNYYVRFTAGETKYMMIGLEYGPSDAILNWAGEIIAANPDYKVIITTHAYLFRDGTTLDINDVVPPRKPTDSASTKNNGDQLWTKLASQYENVFMVLSGHDPCSNVIMRQDTGVNGNTVTQFLVDPQGMSLDTGMVAMLYFSADGKHVQVEWISAYRTLEAQKLDATAGDVIYNAEFNQFDFNIPDKVTPVSVDTKYGTIPAAYSNEVTYPFAVFKADKTFIGAYGDLGAATAAAKAKGKSGHYNVLMRRDAEQNTKSSGLVTITGSLTIDLDGHTLYKTAVGYVFDFYVDDNSGAKLNNNNIDVKGKFSIVNGAIKSYDASHPIACVNYGASLKYSFSVDFEFKNVKFTDTNAGCHILDTWENGYSGSTLPIYASVLFDNCTFDYAGSAEETRMIYLTNKDGKDRVIWNVEIRGGQILSNTAITYDTFVMADGNENGREDKITFTVGNDGKYITQILPESAAAPSLLDTWAEGDESMFFVLGTTSDGNTTYDLIVGNISDYGLETDYGFVPNSEIDPVNYPILLFKDGEYIGRYNVFADGTDGGGVLSKVKALTDGDVASEIGSTVEILFIGDAKATGILPNVGQILGKVIIDLGGHSLIQKYASTSTSALFNTQGKNWKGMNDATFEVFNGNVVLQTQLLSFNAHGKTYNDGEGYKTFHMSFKNVNFSYVENAQATCFLGKFGEGSEVYNKKVGYDLTFTDCTFDFTNASSMELVMNANDNKITAPEDSVSVNSIVNVEILGGKIITANSGIDFYEIIDNGSSVVFGKSGDKYTEFELVGNTVQNISNSVLTKDGIVFVFAKGTVSEDLVNYQLIPEVVAEYSVKSSISLWSNFVYNVYLLKSDSLSSISVDGENYDKAMLEVIDIDGVDYYLIKVDLSAKESLRDIKLVLTLTTEGKNVKYSATLNVVKYATLILDGEHSAEEKTLVRDMLSYAKAAYAHFETVDEAKLAAVDEIIGVDYDAANKPDMSKAALKPAEDRGFDDVTVNLDSVPSFRFYLSEGYTAGDFVFTLDSNAVEVREGSNENGDYLEIVAYAYRLCDIVSYTVTVEDVEYTEEFNIYSYYGYVLEKHSDDAELINLVERICKYSESAESYRSYVIG